MGPTNMLAPSPSTILNLKNNVEVHPYPVPLWSIDGQGAAFLILCTVSYCDMTPHRLKYCSGQNRKLPVLIQQQHHRVEPSRDSNS